MDGVALRIGLDEVFKPVAVEVHPTQPGILALGIEHGKTLGQLEVDRLAIRFLQEGLAGLMDQRLRHTIVIEINGVGRQARVTDHEERQHTGRTNPTNGTNGAASHRPKSGQAHFPRRSRMLRVMRSTIGSRPRSPCDQSVEPQVNTVPPRVYVPNTA